MTFLLDIIKQKNRLIKYSENEILGMKKDIEIVYKIIEELKTGRKK